MKKTLIITLASIAFVSCSQDETVATMEYAAIEFDKVFVENSTRAAVDLTVDNLSDFAVYGSVVKGEQKGNIFNNQKVTGSKAGGYTYSPAQYWIPGANYHFTAIAPFADAKWTYAGAEGSGSQYGTTEAQKGTITFNNGDASASQDLLWAYQTAETADAITKQPDAVSFSFKHLLSRVKFTFKNGFATGSNIQLKVKDVKITNAHKQGTIAFDAATMPESWTAQNTETADQFVVSFGNAGTEANYAPQASASTDHFYLIPVAQASYTIEFTIDLYQAGVLLQENIAKQTTITIPTMQRGYSYDFKAELNASNTSNDGALEPIEFKVSGVEGWTEENVTVPNTPSN